MKSSNHELRAWTLGPSEGIGSDGTRSKFLRLSQPTKGRFSEATGHEIVLAASNS